MVTRAAKRRRDETALMWFLRYGRFDRLRLYRAYKEDGWPGAIRVLTTRFRVAVRTGDREAGLLQKAIVEAADRMMKNHHLDVCYVIPWTPWEYNEHADDFYKNRHPSVRWLKKPFGHLFISIRRSRLHVCPEHAPAAYQRNWRKKNSNAVRG